MEKSRKLALILSMCAGCILYIAARQFLSHEKATEPKMEGNLAKGTGKVTQQPTTNPIPTRTVIPSENLVPFSMGATFDLLPISEKFRTLDSNLKKAIATNDIETQLTILAYFPTGKLRADLFAIILKSGSDENIQSLVQRQSFSREEFSKLEATRPGLFQDDFLLKIIENSNSYATVASQLLAYRYRESFEKLTELSTVKSVREYAIANLCELPNYDPMNFINAADISSNTIATPLARRLHTAEKSKVTLWLQNLQDSPGKERIVQSFTSFWLTADSIAASEWVRSSPDASIRRAGASSISDFAWQRGDSEAAAAWDIIAGKPSRK